MAMTIYCSSDEKWCFAEQSAWGTAIGDTAASVGILTEGFGLNSGINFRNPQRARGQRYPTLADQQAEQKGVVYQTEGMAFPVTTDTIDYFLYGTLQRIVTEINLSGVYAKVFRFPLTQPDFTTNEGKFFTLWNPQQEDSTDAKMYDAIISELTLSCSPDSNEGVLWAAPTFISRYHSNTANYTGTVTYPTLNSTYQKYFYDLYQVQLDSTDIILGNNGFTLTIKNNAAKLGVNTTNNVFSSFVLPRFEVELSIQILWDATARSIMAKAKAGTSISFAASWGATANDNGNFALQVNGKCTNAANLEHAVDGNFVTLNISAGGTYGGTEPFQAAVSNLTERSW